MMRPGAIIVIDNEHTTMDLTTAALRARFPGRLIREILCEEDFIDLFPQIIKAPLALIISGMRVRYCFPRESLPEMRNHDLTLAGLRCWQLVRSHEVTRQTPFIFYSPIDERHNAGDQVVSDLNTDFIQHESDSEHTKLLAAVEEALGGSKAAAG